MDLECGGFLASSLVAAYEEDSANNVTTVIDLVDRALTNNLLVQFRLGMFGK